ncbi:MAG TPA: hypothetical protein VEA40_11190 [Ramlibacter sp.]|nr:hypothetical protein [Ramlibacter sp.]
MQCINEWAFLQGLLGKAEERVLEWDIHGVTPVPDYLRHEVRWLREEVELVAPDALRLLQERGAANETQAAKMRRSA